MKALVVDKLQRSFGGIPAVNNVSFQVPPGRVTGLIGPNGAGKTTVVNLVSGLLKVTSGTIRLGDEDVTEADAARLAYAGIARTFQNIRLIENASVLTNVLSGFHRHQTTGVFANLVGFPSATRERRKFEEKAMDLIMRFKMAPFARHPAGMLSYGHQRRVEMMRALAMAPSVLLLDEPVAGMNDVEAASLADIFRSVAAEGVSILLIEHNMRFVMSLCEHIYVLASGSLIAEGSPEEVSTNPRVIESYLGT